MDIVISFATWIVAIYSFRLAIWGSPTYSLIRSVPYPVLMEAMNSIDAAEAPDSDPTTRFLRRYFAIKVASLLIVMLEFFCLAWFLFTETMLVLPLFLLLKRVAALQLLYRVPEENDQHVLQIIRDLPPWQRRWERINHLITALGFVVLFLRVENFL